LVRLSQRLPLESVVIPPVLEFFSDPFTHNNTASFRVHSQIAFVEEPVKVASHQQTVREFMAFDQRVRLDVRCVHGLAAYVLR
jgi:hypothetical protein